MVVGFLDGACLHLNKVDVFAVARLRMEIKLVKCSATSEGQMIGKIQLLQLAVS